MLKIAYKRASLVLVIFHYFMLQNKLSNLTVIMIQYDVGGCVIGISYKVEYLAKERSSKNSTKEVILFFYLTFLIQPPKRWTKFVS